jgi:hypothetical protein
VWADQHVLPGAEIVLDPRQAAPFDTPTVRRAEAILRPAVPVPAVEENPYFVTPPELPYQGLPQLRLIP